MLYVLQLVGYVVMFLAWWVAVVTGRIPRGMRDLLAYWLRYQGQTTGYLAAPHRPVPVVQRPLLNVETVDYHTGGEPFRIVTGGVPPLEGTTILERRRFARDHLDAYRRLLVFEPRGHADMYGCHVVPPKDDGADLGVVFFHNEGYSTACGHGTIALVTWALDEGVVERLEGENRVVVDVPSGRLETWAHVVGGARAVGALPQRARRSSGRASLEAGGRVGRRRVRRRLLRLARGARRAGRAAAADRARPPDQGRPRGGARGRPPARARAA